MISLSIGAALVTFGIRSDADWFDRHVLTNYCPRAPSTLVYETCARWAAVLAAMCLVLVVRPKIARWASRPKRTRYAAARIVGAISLALALCDVVLRFKSARRLEDDDGLPPMRIDETGNYVPLPSRVKEFDVQGRSARYEINADGNRSAHVGDIADPRAPTILFTGESITLGWGVAYEQSYPALVGRALGVQSVNLAVTGFSSDQAFLRLRDALPRFAVPVALVTIVVPVQLERNVNDLRQRLAIREGRLEIVPRSTSWFRTSPLGRLIPYRSDDALPLTRAILRATDELARERGSRAIFVFTDFGAPCLAEKDGRSRLEKRLFSGLGVTYARVAIPPALTIRYPNEVHPNEAGHEAIAAAILRILRSGV